MTMIRAARAGESALLTELALRSKAHWGHDEDFMERCRHELTLDEQDLDRLVVLVAERAGVARPVGMAAVDVHAGPPELAMLFVEPEAIGTGAGGALLDAALAAACRRGIPALQIESDPDAVGFYLHRGARRIGERRSPSTGRPLPLLELATT